MLQVSQYLRSKKWDTRVAAAHAIGAIADNVKHTSATELSSCVDGKMLEAGISATFDDVVALPNWHSRTGAGTSFRRFFSLYAVCIFFHCFFLFLTACLGILCWMDILQVVSSHDGAQIIVAYSFP